MLHTSPLLRAYATLLATSIAGQMVATCFAPSASPLWHTLGGAEVLSLCSLGVELALVAPIQAELRRLGRA